MGRFMTATYSSGSSESYLSILVVLIVIIPLCVFLDEKYRCLQEGAMTAYKSFEMIKYNDNYIAGDTQTRGDPLV